jgi:hypothetical protein
MGFKLRVFQNGETTGILESNFESAKIKVQKW